MININPKISVIVPIHNAGNRLKKCIDTLIQQTLKEIEIILILDCPTDGSDEIAKQYALIDERIVIVQNQQNLHIGESRNRGLEVAKGEYIGFSDHDDFRELTMYEKTYARAIMDNADIVMSYQLDSQDEINRLNEKFDMSVGNFKEKLLSDLIGFGNIEGYGAFFVNITNNIYKKDLIISNKIQFVDTKRITPEDVLFQIECIYRALKISVLKESFYYHVSHESNEGSNYSYIGYEKRSAGIAKIYSFLLHENIFEQYKDSFYVGVTKQFLFALSGTLYPKKNIFKFIKAVKHLRSYPFCKIAFTNYSLQTTKQKIKNKLFRFFLVSIMKY
jgi:glycosyltransferase involved in cell wall biosynthesis